MGMRIVDIAVRWLCCHLGFHTKYFAEFHHHDDAKVHEFLFCQDCGQVFLFILPTTQGASVDDPSTTTEGELR
jgi:hypothetical protein